MKPMRAGHTRYSFAYTWKKNADMTRFDVYTQLVAYVFSLPLAWLLLNYTKISANMVTIAALVVGVAGAGFGAVFGVQWIAAGFFLFLVLDLTDGRVAHGRGGATSLGAFLDMVTDRCVLFSATIALAYRHMLRAEQAEMFLLIVYIVALLFMDMLAYANLIATAKCGKGPLGISHAFVTKDIDNTLKNTLSLSRWVPGRLSSCLFIMAAATISGSLKIAYMAGILAASAEYLLLGVPRIFTLGKAGSK